MINITFKKGNKSTSININKIKYLVGNNSLEKIKILRLFDEFNSNLSTGKNISNTADELILLINGKSVNTRTTNIIKVDYNFALYQNFKLQANSILLKSLTYQLSDIDYNDIYETIESLLNSICYQFNEKSNIKIVNTHFSHSQFIKLIEPKLIIDENIINEFDLSLQDYIFLQLDILHPVVKNNNMLNIILLDYPIINKCIVDKLQSIENSIFIIKCDVVYHDNDINNYYLLNEDTFDLADENIIYENICCNILNNSNIEEGIIYMKNLIKNKIYSINMNKIN